MAARGLLIETREDVTPRRGRPRIRLEINAGGAIVLGVSLTGGSRLNATFVDLAGGRLFETDVALPYPESVTGFAHDLAAALETIIAASAFATASIARVAIAVPAIIDAVSGTVLVMWTLPSGPVPFARIVADRLGLPVTIENDLTCMARAEHWFGRAQDLDTFSLIHFDLSIGSATFRDGLPADGIHSEFGHSKTDAGPAAPTCYCGTRGCLAAVASMYGMARDWEDIGDEPREVIPRIAPTIANLLDHVDAGDARAKALVIRAATHLGAAIAGRINADDPQAMLVIIPDRRLHDALESPVRQAIDAHALPPLLRRTTIIFADSLPDWRQKGAAALALEKLFLDEHVSLAPPPAVPPH
ncbi:MAG: ROK family protein [Sphingomonas sp.]